MQAIADALIAVDLGDGARGYFTTRAPAPAGEGGPYAGFNLALHVGDDAARVEAHRHRLARALGIASSDAAEVMLGADGRVGIAWMNQVHSARIAGARTDAVPTADALVLNTRTPPVGPGDPRPPAAAAVLVADCVPLLLAGVDGTAVAAVHAGRRGFLADIVPTAVAALVAAGAEPDGIRAAIGPSICGSCYEVGAELQAEAAAHEPACSSTTRWGTPGIDLAAGVTAQLERAGVRRILNVCRCTYEQADLYSYRRDGVTGRQAGIVLPTSAWRSQNDAYAPISDDTP